MARLKIFWTDIAIRQRNEIFKYGNNRNNSTSFSKKLNAKIKERLALLKDHPDVGHRSAFIDARVISLRFYMIVYKIIDDKIFILSLWDSRQDPDRLLQILKNR